MLPTSEPPLLSFDDMVLLELPECLCCLIPLNTTMEQISHDFSCVPGYYRLSFSYSGNYHQKLFWVMRRSKLFVFLTFKDSLVAQLALSVLWDKEEESWKAAPPVGGRLLPPVFMIWETCISLGTGIPYQMPKGRGYHTVLFILILQNSLEQPNREMFHRRNSMVHIFLWSRALTERCWEALKK